MKKKFISLLVLLMVLPLLSSANLEMRDNFERGETIVTKISGNFYDPPEEDDIYFVRDEYPDPVSFETNLIKFGDDYFLSAETLSKEPRNYTMVIENVEYSVEGSGKSSDSLKKNFSISDDYADFAVSPAVLESEGRSFSLEIENLQSRELNIDVNKEGVSRSFSEEDNESWSFSSWFGGSNQESNNDSNYSPEESFIIGPSENKEVSFEFQDINEDGLHTMSLSTESFGQEIFVNVFGDNLEPEEATNETRNFSSVIAFERSFLDLNMSSNETANRTLGISNKENFSVRDISIYVEGEIKKYLSLSTDYLARLNVNETDEFSIAISINESFEGPEKFSGAINANSSDGDYSDYLNVSLSVNSSSESSDSFLDNQSSDSRELDENTSSVSVNKSCMDLNGKICGQDKKCDGETEYTQRGKCCLSKNCVEKEEDSSTGTIVGWVILGFLVLAFVWFYLKKYKKTSNKPNLEKYTKKKSAKKGS